MAVVAAALALGVPAAAAQDGSARVYVRRVEFAGVERTADHVLRRELLQLEGAYLNTVALDESVRRLRALAFIETVDVEIRPVPDRADLVDIALSIGEAAARRYGGGGGWSESLRASVRLYYADHDLLGSGQRLSIAAEASKLRSSLEISHTAPRVRGSEVGRTVGVSSRRVDRLTHDASIVDAKLSSVVLEYGYPLARQSRPAALPFPIPPPRTDPDTVLPTAEVRERLEALGDVLEILRPTACCGSLRLGLALRRATLAPAADASVQLREWIADVGGGSDGDGTHASAELDEVDFTLRYRHDTRDRAVFAQQGVEHDVRIIAALPGSDIDYALVDYRVSAYRPVGSRWTVRALGRIGYGAGYGDTPSLPPYLHWLAGGSPTVRGYRENSVGPRDSLGNPYGGNVLVSARIELMTPWPARWRERVRVGFFADAGNVFSTEGIAFTDAVGRPLDYGVDASALKRSVGIGAEILSAFGALRLSYALPLGADDQHPNPYLRDDVDRFQVSLGVGF